MSRGNYSFGKRQREAEKARKKKEKADRRLAKRDLGPTEPEIVSAEDITGHLPSVEQAMRDIAQAAEAPRAASTIPCRLFVGGLSWGTDEKELRGVFEKFGPVADAAVVKNRDTGESRGFGFVTMADRKDATKAIKALDGAEIGGRNIVVNIATDRQR